jgi:hypothetical protein
MRSTTVLCQVYLAISFLEPGVGTLHENLASGSLCLGFLCCATTTVMDGYDVMALGHRDDGTRSRKTLRSAFLGLKVGAVLNAQSTCMPKQC